MPDDRLTRARRSLPAGYQFPTPEHVHYSDAYDVQRALFLCRCGARAYLESGKTWFFPDWNVIEGESHDG